MAGNTPFSWQSKAARRLIREKFGDTNNIASALGVYDALTEIASDKGADEFQTTQDWISHISGFSPRTVRSTLPELEAIKLVEIHAPPLRAPATYRLLPCGNGCPTSGNGCRAIGNQNENPLPPSEERQKKRINEPRKPLSTPERIALEKQLALLQSKLKKAQDDAYYPQDRTPELMAEIKTLKSQIENAEQRLLAQ